MYNDFLSRERFEKYLQNGVHFMSASVSFDVHCSSFSLASLVYKDIVKNFHHYR